MSAQQHTIAHRVDHSGQALHSGKKVTISLLPGPPDSGIVFHRTDLPGAAPLKANMAAVVDTKRCTSIGRDGWRIGTVEHLLAAAHGLGLDNMEVLVDGEELPVGDGSALFFADLIVRAGLTPQEKPRRIMRVTEPVWVVDGQACLVMLPPEQPCFSAHFTFCADHRAINSQHFYFNTAAMDFKQEIAPARTVAFVEEIEALRAQGLARCDNWEVAVIVGPEGYLNSLRLPDEIVRHKILDLLGDLYLVGPLHGQVVAVRSGHTLNHRLAKELMRPGCLVTVMESETEDVVE